MKSATIFLSKSMFRSLRVSLLGLLAFLVGMTSEMASASAAEQPPAAPAEQPPVAAPGHPIHMVLGATAAPYALFNIREQGRPYIGLTLMPELRLAFSLNKKDSWRFFVAGRYTGFSLATNFKNEAPATPASEVPLMGALGVSARIAGPRDSITTSLAWVSFQVGYANFKVKDTTFITGPVVMISFDTDALSFNLGD